MSGNETLGNKLRYLRYKRDLSQLQLATILNTTRQSVSNWEHDRNRPDYETLIELSRILNVSVDYLLDKRSSTKSGVK